MYFLFYSLTDSVLCSTVRSAECHDAPAVIIVIVVILLLVSIRVPTHYSRIFILIFVVGICICILICVSFVDQCYRAAVCETPAVICSILCIGICPAVGLCLRFRCTVSIVVIIFVVGSQ